MGGSKSQTIGYRYYAGMHMVLCHGPIDNLSRIKVDEKVLWEGINTGGTTGFASGTITLGTNVVETLVLFTTIFVAGVAFNFVPAGYAGSATQGNMGATVAITAANLAAKMNAYFGSLTVTSSGNVIKVTSNIEGPSGDAITLGKTEFFANNITLSGSTLTGGTGRIVINQPNIFGGDSREGGISGQLDVLSGRADQGQNDYLVSRLGSLVPAFRGVASVVLRQMYLSMNPYLKTWSFRAQRIHVQQDGSAQWQDGYAQINVVVYDDAGNLTTAAAMNPAHIIRECLTNKLWGMGYNEDDVNEASFLAAAITFFNESMGMALLWDTQTSIEDFVKIVLQHVDASLYVDRKTGQFTLKPIRGGYDENDLLVLDPSNVDKLEDFKRPAFGELANSITVNYWDYSKDQTGSVTVQDIALSQEQGGENATTVTYEGFIDPATASKAAQRDLRSLSTPLISCTVYATKVARGLNIGDVFILSWPDYQIESVVMRVTGIAYGDGKTRRVRIQCAQDVFSYPEDAFVSKPPSGWVDPSGPPGAIAYRQAFELPYYDLVRDNGQSVVDSSISSNPYVGYVGSACAGPFVPALNALMYTDDGGGYEEVGYTDFCAGALLGEDLDRMQDTFEILAGVSLELVEANEWLQVGSELMGVVSLTGTTLTVKRGVLDTVPTTHSAGETILFWDGYSSLDPTEYVSSDTVDVKLVSVNGSGVYPLDSTSPQSVELVGRAARPFPPGKLQFNAQYFPTDDLSGAIVISWANRNRVFQTGGTLIGFVDDAITPEAGQTTTLAFYDKLGFKFLQVDGIATETYTLTPGDYSTYDDFITVEAWSVRDGLESFTRHSVQISISTGIDGGTLVFELDTTGTAPAGDNLDFELT